MNVDLHVEHHVTTDETGAASYSVEHSRGVMFLKASHFAPGYTSGHQPTPEQAVDAYVEKCFAEIEVLRKKILEAQSLLPAVIVARIDHELPVVAPGLLSDQLRRPEL